jgi:hypothetical protein
MDGSSSGSVVFAWLHDCVVVLLSLLSFCGLGLAALPFLRGREAPPLLDKDLGRDLGRDLGGGLGGGKKDEGVVASAAFTVTLMTGCAVLEVSAVCACVCVCVCIILVYNIYITLLSFYVCV